MKIRKILEAGVLLALVIRQIHEVTDTEFFTNPEDILQLGMIQVTRDRQIMRHRHNNLQRRTEGTSEVLLILEGKVNLQVYSLNSDTLIESIDLIQGDLVILVAGGHSFTSETESKMLEVKNGPYDFVNDKVYF